MRFLPFEKFVIETSLTKEEVIAELVNNIGTKESGRKFEGLLGNDEFEITRVKESKNSFLPIVKGKIEPFGIKTRVMVRMSVHPIVVAFMSILFSLVGISTIVPLIAGNGLSLESNFPFYVIGFSAYAVMMLGYVTEAKKSKILLSGIIQGQIVNR